MILFVNLNIKITFYRVRITFLESSSLTNRSLGPISTWIEYVKRKTTKKDHIKKLTNKPNINIYSLRRMHFSFLFLLKIKYLRKYVTTGSLTTQLIILAIYQRRYQLNVDNEYNTYNFAESECGLSNSKRMTYDLTCLMVIILNCWNNKIKLFVWFCLKTM